MSEQTLIAFSLSAAAIAFVVMQLVLRAVRSRREQLQDRLTSQKAVDDSPTYQSIVLPKAQDWAAGGNYVAGTFRKALSQAYPSLSPTVFLAITAALALATFMAAALVTQSVAAGVLAALLIAGLPFLMISRRRAARLRAVHDQLPDALDFITRILKAGHSLATALQMSGDELPVPLGPEFSRAYAQHSLGQPLEDSLKDMANRVDVPDFAFVVTAVLIQRQTGGDLAEVLKNIANMVRARIRLRQHVKAITAQGRMVGVILLGLPFVFYLVLYLIDPDYAGVLIHHREGNILIVAALVMQTLGLLLIRKIVDVKM